MSKRAVFGIVPTRRRAEEVVHELHEAGFKSRDLSVLFSGANGENQPPIGGAHAETHAPDGAAIGATAGTAIGGVLGLLAGIGALAIPGIGPFIAAGPILATLGGLISGATVGGVGGALVGLGIPEAHARTFEAQVNGGQILISAHCESADEIRRALSVFTQLGATDVITTFEGARPNPVSTTRQTAMRR